jgi:hypothetical protein
MFPAQSYLRTLKKRTIQEWYYDWLENIPEEHIERFLQDGLIPFLKKHGYSVLYDTSFLHKACYEWSFGHVRIQRQKSKMLDRTFLKCAHNGGEEEFEWYVHSIPTENWLQLCSIWKQEEFLDDSETGYAQMCDLYLFAWQLIDLENSKAHHKWLDIISYVNDTLDEPSTIITMNPDDYVPYGGDRRTL